MKKLYIVPNTKMVLLDSEETMQSASLSVDTNDANQITESDAILSREDNSFSLWDEDEE